MSNDGLKNKAASGMVWTAIQRYSTMIFTFIADIVLARLLMPEDYGCIGMLAIFMGLAENFIDGGFGSALIQKKNPTPADYSTVFLFNIGMAVFIYAILFVSAPFLSDFYHMPILDDVLRVQGLILFVYSFNIIQRNLIRKNLKFKKLSGVTIVASLCSVFVAIFMAYKGYGVWSLVAQNFIMVLIPCIYFWVTTEWRPKWLFSLESFRELFGFGSYMFLTHLINTFATKLSGLLIGRWYNPSIMGFYSKAEKTENLASMNIAQIMIQTTYPLYASIQDDKERLINVIKRITTTLSYVTTPILFILILTAKPLFLLLYSEKWLPSVPYFQFLCLAGLAGCLQGVNIQAVAAVGKSKDMFVWTVLKRGVGILLNVGGLVLFGIYGLIVGNIISSWFSYLINIYLVSKHVGYKCSRQIMDLAPAIVVAIGATIASVFLESFLSLSIYWSGVVRFLLFIIIYLGWSLVYKPSAYVYTMSTIHSLLKKKKQ